MRVDVAQVHGERVGGTPITTALNNNNDKSKNTETINGNKNNQLNLNSKKSVGFQQNPTTPTMVTNHANSHIKIPQIKMEINNGNNNNNGIEKNNENTESSYDDSGESDESDCDESDDSDSNSDSDDGNTLITIYGKQKEKGHQAIQEAKRKENNRVSARRSRQREKEFKDSIDEMLNILKRQRIHFLRLCPSAQLVMFCCLFFVLCFLFCLLMSYKNHVCFCKFWTLP